MVIPFLDLKKQYLSLKDEIDEAMNKVVVNSAFVGGVFVRQFEKDFADYLGVKNCVSCGNGTDALLIALKSLDIGEGNEVIVPANSFIATSEAVTAAGAKVVFCDVDDISNNIDVSSIEEKINNHTRAIIVVHLYGRPTDMDPILQIASKYGLKVIEDSAQAHGAQYKGRMAGTLADVACFSFYPGKNLGAYGDGGAIVTNNDALATYMRMLANHGRIEKYNHEFEGFNSRLDGIQAAVLSAKLPHLDQWIENRRKVAALYREGLSDCDQIQLPQETDGYYSVYHLFAIKTDKRDELQAYLKEHGIATGIHYPIGLPFLKAYKYLGHSYDDFPVTAKNQSRLLSLPIYPEMTTEQVEYVINTIKTWLAKM